MPLQETKIKVTFINVQFCFCKGSVLEGLTFCLTFSKTSKIFSGSIFSDSTSEFYLVYAMHFQLVRVSSGQGKLGRSENFCRSGKSQGILSGI